MHRRTFTLTITLVLACFGMQLTAQERAKTDLPMAWLGKWQGEVTAQTPAGANNKFQMELEIARRTEPHIWTWKITYRGPQGDSVRDYQLVADATRPGQFVIDEGNGIRIAATLLGSCLQTHFSIGGQTLWTRYALTGTDQKELDFELVTADETNPLVSGGKDDIPKVTSLIPASRQIARLQRAVQEASTEQPADKSPPDQLSNWKKLETEVYRGKQDDIYFVNAQVGWYANGAGKIFKTTNGGQTWTKQIDQPGTYFRCLAFFDEQHGWAGNIGPGYFPNVTDNNPLYETKDGGQSWQPVKTIEGPPVVGLCALQVLKEEYINAGKLDYRVRLIGVGRVGGPTAMIVSDDLGATWQQLDIAKHAAMAFDVYFANRNEGFIAAASDADVASSNAVILRTADGGKTWQKAYQSSRPYELTWKISFPTRNVGYVTIQSYNPDPKVSERFVAKTTDGGLTWQEVALIDNASVREFGIAFLNENIGWVGAVPHGFLTVDGGKSWSKANIGNAVNKIRLLEDTTNVTGFAIGTEVHKLEPGVRR